VFCSIVARQEDAHRVLEDEHTVAFLDARPLFPGHTLVVPRVHHDTLTSLPVTQIEPLFQRVRWLAKAVQEAMGAEGTFVAINNVVSQSVPHLHVHIVPRTKGDGLRGFFWPRQGYGSDEHATEVADLIRKAIGVETEERR
jgi:histidine triad (HIT) family protein